MIDLVLDTSNQYLYLAILQDGRIQAEKRQKGNNNHSETLLDALADMMDKLELESSDIDRIFVGRGPGSYTGVRVSVTVAKVLAFVKDIELYSFSSLDLLLSPLLNEDGIYVISIDARRGFVFGKVMEVRQGEIMNLRAEEYISFETLSNEYPAASYINDLDPNYQIEALLNHGLYERVDNVHLLVPKYLRSGI